LPDGRWLTAGGLAQSGPGNQAVIMDVTANTTTPLGSSLAKARAWHTATVLPNGTVLILGGMDLAGLVESVELFDAANLQFQALPANAPAPRAYHTATVLTDGTVLIAGGVSREGRLLLDAELWDPQTGIATV